jgi:hypothetical protein
MTPQIAHELNGTAAWHFVFSFFFWDSFKAPPMSLWASEREREREKEREL